MNKTKRQSGVELLRIFAMLQIIYLHAYQYGKLGSTVLGVGESAEILVTIIWGFCRTGVDIFMMLSGYFLITSSFDLKKTTKRALGIYATMFFYSVVLSMIFFATKFIVIDKIAVWQMCTPFFSRRWYFLSNYLIILLVSPFLNKMLTNLNKKQYLYFLGLLIVVFSIWPILSSIEGIDEVISMKKITETYLGKSLGGFLLYYVIGGYLRLFVPIIDEKTARIKECIKYTLIFLILCGVDIKLDYVINEYDTVFGAFNHPIVLLESICLLLIFRNFKFYSKLINLLAGTTLGIYAIHEHPYMREWIWQKINFTDKSLYEHSWYILLIVLICIVGIFLFGFLCELIRAKLFSFLAIRISKKNTD